MNILLTGGAGYIGSHTAVVLSQAGHEVVLLDNFCNSKKSVLGRLQKILGRVLPCVVGDVRDTMLVTKTLQYYKIDSVIHFAGLKAVGESTEKPIEYYSNNVQGAICLLEAMKSTNVRNLVFSSSATVYGNPEYLPLDEKHPVSATNPYGRTKLHIEEMLKDVANSDLSWRIICLRYFNPVGAHESGLIREDPQGVPNNLVPYIIKVASGELSRLNIFGDDYKTKDGTGERDYIHVMDIAHGHLKAIEHIAQLPIWSAMNLSTGVSYSVQDVIAAFEKILDKKISYQIASRRVGDVAIVYGSATLAHEKICWRAQYSLEEMLQDSWRGRLSASEK